MMKKAGIKFFILTGDKKQTAVSIGRSCGLIDPHVKIFSYPDEKREAELYKNEKVYLIDASEDIQEMPVDVFNSQTICYRCTPMQKQNVVNYVK
jgi:magnesium-transporting ATPase (P-type)